MTITARHQISEMTVTTEQTLAETLGWASEEERLYRDCPTAFWLAPDGDGVLPPPPAGPKPPTPVLPLAADPVAVDGMGVGIFRAMMAAGPIFAATALLLLPTEADRTWLQPIGRALASLAAFPLTIVFGAALAVLPLLTGVVALGFAGRSIARLRTPGAWAATGGVMGAAIATLCDAGGPAGLALIATSVACAAIARTAIAWSA
jgi:hypothetical protein